MTDLSFSVTSSTTGATGEHTTRGLPHGVTALTPFLVVEGASRALEWYRDVLGARVVDVTRVGDLVAHAVLDLGGNGQLQLGDPMPAYHLVPPPPGDDDCYSLGLYVEDVDAVLDAAVRAGATVREPAANFVSGDRFASLRDPFGVRWSLLCRVEDLSEEQSAARVREWAEAGMPQT